MTDRIDPEIERNLGEQPITRVMAEEKLSRHDLVAISTERLTHKMVARACKGRRLTPKTKGKVVAALNAAASRTYAVGELFNY